MSEKSEPTPDEPTAEEHYTHGHHESVLRAHSWRTIANSAQYLSASLAPGLTLLDVGCGPGTITVEFADRLAPGRVVGLDASSEIIEKATADFSRPNLEFVVGNAYELDFDDDTFDIVHAHQVLQHVAEPVRLLQELRRVTKPGGLVAARDVDYGGVIWYPLLPGLAAWLELYDRVHLSNGGEPNAGRRLKSWALRAGFASVETTASVWNFSNDADRSWWGGAWADRALKSGFAVDALAKGLGTQAELDAISAAWLEWAASEEGWLLMPHGELLARK